MPTNTTNLSLKKPIVGADEDLWGGYINDNLDDLDNYLSGNTAIPALDVTGDLTVDANTLYVDSTNDRVGINTSSPDEALHISGSTNPTLRIENTSTSLFGGNVIGSIEFEGNDTDAAGVTGIIKSVSEGSTGTSAIVFDTGSGGSTSEAMRINSSGNLLVGTTDTGITSSSTTEGVILSGDYIGVARTSNPTAYFNRMSTDGDIAVFRKNGTTVGSIGVASGNNLYISSSAGDHAGLEFSFNCVIPQRGGTLADNIVDLGATSYRYDDIYATNGTIQTSDRNEKQQIASLTDAEMQAAKAISALFKTFKWNDKVAEKGDAARKHAGVIAQDVQQAMADAGLDAGDYAFFISNTWWETQTEVPAVESVAAQDAVYDEEGNLISEAVEAVEAQEAYTRTDTYDTLEEAPEGATERTRLGIRYPELLAFIGAATEQRLASIEARLDAIGA